jgi:hypothetical protein
MIRPSVIYDTAAQNPTKRDELQINVWVSRVLRRFGLTYDKGEKLRRVKTNKELRKLFQEINLVITLIKSRKF